MRIASWRRLRIGFCSQGPVWCGWQLAHSGPSFSFPFRGAERESRFEQTRPGKSSAHAGCGPCLPAALSSLACLLRCCFVALAIKETSKRHPAAFRGVSGATHFWKQMLSLGFVTQRKLQGCSWQTWLLVLGLSLTSPAILASHNLSEI